MLWQPPGPDNYQIETPSRALKLWLMLDKAFERSDDASLLVSGNQPVGGHDTRLDLDGDEHAAAPGHDIDFARGRTLTPRHDAVTLQTQQPHPCGFGETSETLRASAIACRHDVACLSSAEPADLTVRQRMLTGRTDECVLS